MERRNVIFSLMDSRTQRQPNAIRNTNTTHTIRNLNTQMYTCYKRKTTKKNKKPYKEPNQTHSIYMLCCVVIQMIGDKVRINVVWRKAEGNTIGRRPLALLREPNEQTYDKMCMYIPYIYMHIIQM